MTSSSRLFLLAAPGDPAATGEATASTAPTTSSAPASTPVGDGTGLVPPVKPNMNSTGMAGFTDLTNTIAGWAPLGSLAAFLLSALVFVIGRPFVCGTPGSTKTSPGSPANTTGPRCPPPAATPGPGNAPNTPNGSSRSATCGRSPTATP